MAKEYKHATLICVILSILALIGIIFGIIYKNPMVITLLLLPAAAYEVYRTEGFSTRMASAGMLGILAAELVLIIAKINIDLAKILGMPELRLRGYILPLGDVKVIAPVLIAVLSIILIKKTGGKYTIWLAVVIFLTSLVLIYTLNPEIFSLLLKSGGKIGAPGV